MDLRRIVVVPQSELASVWGPSGLIRVGDLRRRFRWPARVPAGVPRCPGGCPGAPGAGCPRVLGGARRCPGARGP
eukprot:6925572-Pyramimonas_sp.AAC.1